MADKNKKSFDVGDKVYAVRKPTVEEIRKANEIRSKTFNEALQRGDMLREQLESELRKRKLWSDGREEEYQGLRQDILDGEYKLKKGGIKLSNAKNVALKMSAARSQMVQLLSSRTDLDSNTCEGKADAARFNYLFAVCLVYDDSGESYFDNGLDDYLLNQDDPVALAGASHFYYLLSGSEDVDSNLPENQFLKRFDFVDEDNRLVDSEGKLIDGDGRHVDKFGNLIRWIDDEEFEYVDTEGRTVNDDGDYDVDFVPFLDDEGNAIEEEEEEAEEDVVEEKPKAAPKKRATKKKKTTTKKKAEPKAKVEEEAETGQEQADDAEEEEEDASEE
jgi:hypothetical protein|tara:strand:- start:3176 stop:4171 length:996 start_codon:yes stop_codon:yes gene_type:complete